MTAAAWIGVNAGSVGTSPAGRRIRAAGLAYQASHPEVIPNPVALAPTERPVAVALVSPLGDRVSLPGRCREIILEVAAKYGVRPEAIVSPDRRRKFIPARFEAIFRCVAETDFSLGEIGRAFRRDHTTIGASVMRHAKVHGLTPPRGMAWVTADKPRPKGRRSHRVSEGT